MAQKREKTAGMVVALLNRKLKRPTLSVFKHRISHGGNVKMLWTILVILLVLWLLGLLTHVGGGLIHLLLVVAVVVLVINLLTGRRAV